MNGRTGTFYFLTGRRTGASTDGGWTRHCESKSTVHEDVKQESDGTSSVTFDRSKPTDGDASGSVAFTFGGGSGDEWYVLDERRVVARTICPAGDLEFASALQTARPAAYNRATAICRSVITQGVPQCPTPNTLARK